MLRRVGFRTLLVGFVHRAAAVRHEVLTEHDQRAGRDRAGEGLGDGHLADVRVDRAIECQIFGERVHEHQRVVHVRADRRLLGAGLREPQPPLSGGSSFARMVSGNNRLKLLMSL
jgi:hypothetical protein